MSYFIYFMCLLYKYINQKTEDEHTFVFETYFNKKKLNL